GLPLRRGGRERAAPLREQRSGARAAARPRSRRRAAARGAAGRRGGFLRGGDRRRRQLRVARDRLEGARPRPQAAVTARWLAASVAALALLGGRASGQAAPAPAEAPPRLPFGPGESLTMRLPSARLLAGRAWVRVEPGEPGAALSYRFVAEAKSQGFFAWLFHFRVDDHTVATWDPVGGCSRGIEKNLHEGKARREQKIVIDPVSGRATVEDPKIAQKSFDLEPCVLDVLSALFVTRGRGGGEGETLGLPVFDNGKHYTLGARYIKKERLDLPAPLGPDTPTVVVEPQLLEGTGLFVKEGRLHLWLTDDDRRIPVRMQSKVAIG